MDKFRAMHYFMRVADAKSISAAARELDVSQSAVSKVISEFEGEVGFTLFHRSTRRLSLTASGEAYLERCRHIVQELDDAESAGKAQGGAARGTLKVGLHPAFRIAFFSETAALLEGFPELKLETRMTNSPSILLDEGFDVLIRAGELPDSNLVARSIGWLDYVVVAAPRYLERYGVPQVPADLEKHRVAIPATRDDEETFHRWDFFRDDQQCTVTVPVYVTMRDGMGLPETVISGAAIARLLRIAMMRAISDGLVQPLLTQWTSPRHPVYAVFPSARAVTPKSKAVVDLVAELVARADRQARGV